MSIYHPWKPPFNYNPDGQWIEDRNGERIVDIRGWGFLTGKGSLAMDENKAAKIQDDLGKHLTEMMNRDYTQAT